MFWYVGMVLCFLLQGGQNNIKNFLIGNLNFYTVSKLRTWEELLFKMRVKLFCFWFNIPFLWIVFKIKKGLRNTDFWMANKKNIFKRAPCICSYVHMSVSLYNVSALQFWLFHCPEALRLFKTSKKAENTWIRYKKDVFPFKKFVLVSYLCHFTNIWQL